MVHLNQELIHKENGALDTEAWLRAIFTKYANPADQNLLRQSMVIATFSEDKKNSYGESLLMQGLAMANILSELNADASTLVAAILYVGVQNTDLHLEDVNEHLGAKIADLIQGALKMAHISVLYQAMAKTAPAQQNVDNIRKMFLAMIDDVRIVLIKLAEILYILRKAKLLAESEKQKIGSEAMTIYGPLANRLGMIRLKWELEDLAFRYLEPKKYAEISQALQESRIKREKYIEQVSAEIIGLLRQAKIKGFQVKGRAKHIYSIYRKMTRKKVELGGIYDASAIRILVSTTEDCYTALGFIHARWKHIPQEFDDYIANPKPNGYRSLHTAVIGPSRKTIEIQIRTYDIHNESELGVAAHWVYKEGAKQQATYENKITWLRQLLDWQHEVATENKKDELKEIFGDRIYVVTPGGDILDLPRDATPLDFAYQLHSDLGHCCCGAKVNGNIVPLTYKLKTGERVEIITAKKPHPSRDWLNSDLGFLKTTRAKSKVLQWFKKQEQAKQIIYGQELLNKELQRLNLKAMALDKIARALNFKTPDDLLGALGTGELKLSTVLDVIEPSVAPTIPVLPIVDLKTPITKPTVSDLKIDGVDNLLTHLANCCRPLPGDKVIGYITQTRGVSIHKQNCPSVLIAQKNRPERLLQVSWGSKKTKNYPVSLNIQAFDRAGLIRDITAVLTEDNLSVAGLNFSLDKKDNLATIKMTIEIPNVAMLSRILGKIKQVANVLEAKRQ